MRSPIRTTVLDRAVRLAIALAMVFGALSTVVATETRPATCETTVSQMQQVMPCCRAGMAKCQMPRTTKVCGCKQQDDSMKSSIAALPAQPTFELQVAIVPTTVFVGSDVPVSATASQRIRWECDLPPPDSHFGYLPNRAPPSL